MNEVVTLLHEVVVSHEAKDDSDGEKEEPGEDEGNDPVALDIRKYANIKEKSLLRGMCVDMDFWHESPGRHGATPGPGGGAGLLQGDTLGMEDTLQGRDNPLNILPSEELTVRPIEHVVIVGSSQGKCIRLWGARKEGWTEPSRHGRE